MGASDPEGFDLIRRVAQDRDETAFSRLYDQFAPRVFGLACRMMNRREEAEEVLQDVFFTLWEKAATYDAKRAPVGLWIMVMARSRCLDRLRKRSLREGKENSLDVDETGRALLDTLSDPLPPALEGLASDERRREVQSALAALPEAQRAVLEASFFKGESQQEIADRTGEPLGTVKTRMRLGLAKLSETLMDRKQ